MRNFGTSQSLRDSSPDRGAKVEKVEMIMRLCERCSERISDRYYLEPRNLSVSSADTSPCRGGKTIEAGVCGLCCRERAKAYAVMPRPRAKPQAAPIDKRARWQEPWRER